LLSYQIKIGFEILGAKASKIIPVSFGQIDLPSAIISETSALGLTVTEKLAVSSVPQPLAIAVITALP
jgi:hypothetical protein